MQINKCRGVNPKMKHTISGACVVPAFCGSAQIMNREIEIRRSERAADQDKLGSAERSDAPLPTLDICRSVRRVISGLASPHHKGASPCAGECGAVFHQAATRSAHATAGIAPPVSRSMRAARLSDGIALPSNTRWKLLRSYSQRRAISAAGILAAPSQLFSLR